MALEQSARWRWWCGTALLAFGALLALPFFYGGLFEIGILTAAPVVVVGFYLLGKAWGIRRKMAEIKFASRKLQDTSAPVVRR